MKLQEKLKIEYGKLAKHSDVVFLGEGLVNAGRIYGTLDDVPVKKCIEMPICENLIVGCAIGMALKGFHPICVFQRHDFLLVAADAILNHLCMMEKMSGKQFNLPVVLRAIVGSQSKTFDVGMQHKQTYTDMFQPYMDIMDIETDWTGSLKSLYTRKHPILVVEYKDDYGEEI